MRGLSAEEKRRLILSVGTHRAHRAYTPVEVAQCFQKAIDAGSSLQECAEAVQFEGTTMVTRFLRLLHLPPEVQHVVDWGQSGSTLGFTSAFELSRLPSAEQAPATRAALEHRLSASEIRQLVQIRQRSGRPIEESIASVLRLRPTVERRHVVVGAISAGELGAALSTMPQGTRDQLLAEVVRQLWPEAADFSARLGTDRFTIVGDDVLGRTLARAGDFEVSVELALKQRCLDQ